MVPDWLHYLSIFSLAVAVLCAVVIAGDEVRHPQKMAVMNLVWPITTLFGSVAWLWAYYRFGRERALEKDSFAITVAKGTSHCGAGCTLGDILAEVLVLLVPGILLWFGWQSIFDERIFATWVLDFVMAYLLGVVFQYFTIAPMRGLGLREGIWEAIKADTLSLTAWQVGMYAFMAFAKFYLFRNKFGARLNADEPEFWFMMQLAMLLGFVTSYPANWLLLKSGIKKAM